MVEGGRESVPPAHLGQVEDDGHHRIRKTLRRDGHAYKIAKLRPTTCLPEDPREYGTPRAFSVRPYARTHGLTDGRTHQPTHPPTEFPDVCYVLWLIWRGTLPGEEILEGYGGLRRIIYDRP